MDDREKLGHSTGRILPGRRKRIPDEEVRRAVLDAAHGMVEQTGLTVSLEHLSFEEVIQRSGVSRSAAYRLWPRKDKFYVDLLCDLAGPTWTGTAGFDQKTIDIATQIVLDRLDLLETPQGRQRVMREAVRQAALQNFLTLTNSAEWRTYVALTATLVSIGEGETRSQIQSSLEAAENRFVDTMVEFYKLMAFVLGMRLRSPCDSYASLATCGAAIVEGLGLRQIISPNRISGKIVVDQGYGEEEWSLPALGFLAILETMTEPDPNYDLTVVRQTLGLDARGGAEG